MIKMLGPGFALLLAFGPPQESPSPSPNVPAACCYANPQYAGSCVIEPAKGDTCDSILAFLNDPRSQGKTYCDNTSIRGGWKLVKCDAKKASPTPSPTHGGLEGKVRSW